MHLVLLTWCAGPCTNVVASSVHYAEESNSGGQPNVQEKVVKLLQDTLGPVFLLGLLLATLSGSSEKEVLCLYNNNSHCRFD